MVLAEGILVEQHWVGFLVQLLFHIFFLFLLLPRHERLSIYDLLFVQVDVEQDLLLILAEQVRVSSTALEHAESILKSLLEQVIFLLFAFYFLLFPETKRHFCLIGASIALSNKESVYVLARRLLEDVVLVYLPVAG